MRGVNRGLWVLLAALFLAGSAQAEQPEIRAPHLYVSPTVGFWRWDESVLGGAKYEQTVSLMYGLRLGYAPLDALSGEVVVLTGENQVEDAEGDDKQRLTQAEFSFVVNFRGLAVEQVHPFVTLGLGYSFRNGRPVVDGEPVQGDDHLNFHIGIGFKVDMSQAVSVRFNARDTFYTETQKQGSGEVTETVDSVELSIGLDYRIPMGRSNKGERLR